MQAGADMACEGNDKAFLTVSELSARSGLSSSTIHRLKATGKIPYYQPAGRGGTVLFPPDAIERTVAEAPTPTSQPSAPVDAQPRRLSGPRPAWMHNTNPQALES